MDVSGTTYQLLMIISDASFYFLPFILAYTSAQRFKVTPMLAVALAGVMLHPTFATLGESIQFLSIPVSYVNYSSTVFPIIAGVYIMSWIEKFAKKISPKLLAGILVPLLTLIITSPIVLIIVGPIVNVASTQVGNFVIWMTGKAGFIAGPVLGALYPLFVFLGIHTSLVAFELQGISQSGFDPIIAIGACANTAIASVALYLALRSRNQQRKSMAASSAVSGFIGVTEPALYGLVAGRKEHWIAVFAGGAVGGFLMNLFGVKGYGIGPVPLAGIAVFFGDKFLFYLLSLLITVAVTMAVLHILGMGEEDRLETAAKEEKKATEKMTEKVTKLTAPVKGSVVPLAQVNDSTFSEEMLGKGVAILPQEGKVIAPLDGEVETIMDSRHAVGLKCGDIELLIHVGLETVGLNGKYYEAFVKEGDHVKKGDTLLTFDQKAVEEAGYDLITPVIVTNTDEFSSVTGTNVNTQADYTTEILMIERA